MSNLIERFFGKKRPEPPVRLSPDPLRELDRPFPHFDYLMDLADFCCYRAPVAMIYPTLQQERGKLQAIFNEDYTTYREFIEQRGRPLEGEAAPQMESDRIDPFHVAEIHKIRFLGGDIVELSHLRRIAMKHDEDSIPVDYDQEVTMLGREQGLIEVKMSNTPIVDEKEWKPTIFSVAFAPVETGQGETVMIPYFAIIDRKPDPHRREPIVSPKMTIIFSDEFKVPSLTPSE